MLPKVAGLILERTRRESHAFCEDLINVAIDKGRFSGSVVLGDNICEINVSGSGLATQTIVETLVRDENPKVSLPTNPRVYVISREDLPWLPPLEWARGWIANHQIVPELVSYPFRVFLDRHTGQVYVYDTRSRTGVVWIRHQFQTDLRGMITPFRLMWSWLATSIGASVIHASAVHTKHGTAVFAGASGSGKSTTALNLALRGDYLISDDCLWVQDEKCYPVFSRAKVDGDSFIANTLIQHHIALSTYSTIGRSKAFFTIAELNKRRLSPTRVVHIFFPHISPTSRHLMLTPRPSYRRLERDSGRELFTNGVRSRLRIANLCNNVPASLLCLAPDTDKNTNLIHAVLQRN